MMTDLGHGEIKPSIRQRLRRTHRLWRARLDELAYLASHVFPMIYCRSKSLAEDTPMGFLFSVYQKRLRRKLSNRPFWLRASLIVVWPPVVVVTAIGLTAINGPFIARRHQRGIIRQFTDLIELAFLEGIHPRYYYTYELHNPRQRSKSHEYLHRYLLKKKGLYGWLYRDTPKLQSHRAALVDKLAFYYLCKEHDLPTAQVYAAVQDGEVVWSDGAQRQLPERGLFIKPKIGKGGKGAQRWIYRDGNYIGSDGRALNAQELLNHLINCAFDEPLIVQECLVNLQELQDLTAGALSTLRMYTFRNEDGAVEHVFSMFRMSQDQSKVVDNSHAGGIAAAVNQETGELGRATDSALLARTGWLDRHPTTGAQITGRKLPLWQEALDLVMTAHRHLEDIIVVGWDVALTQDGPRLIEGNTSPDIAIEQRLSSPWGNNRFGELLAYNLKAKMRRSRKRTAKARASAA